MHKGYLAGALALAFLTTVPGLARAEADPLSQDEAVRIAMEGGDPAARRFEARAEAEEARAVADAQLPDPKLNARAANVPVDSFDFDQDNMTQLRFGARQAFPPGATLRLRGEQRRDAARVERARHDLVLRKIARDVRLAWLDLYHWRETADLVRESSDAVEEMIVSLRAGFATGGLTRQDVLRAELEVSLLDDRLVELTRRTETARVDLARYVGAAANRPLPGEGLQNEPIPPLGEMEAVLPRHPVVRVEDAEIAVAETEMDLADEAYKPAFGLEGGYGIRQGGRADLASIGVTLSVPLFTGRRQDQRRAAALRARSGEKLDHATVLRDLRRDLHRAHADWQGLDERVALYAEAVTARAEEAAEASVSAYASGVADFPELIRSQLAHLEARITLLELRIRQAQAGVRLDYLAGEAP